MWMTHQFTILLDNITTGLLVFVNDFAQNILLRFQQEPSSIHWVHKQVTLHPSVAYFMCPGCTEVIIKEEIYHLTSCLDHNWKTVDYFMKLNLQHLKAKGVQIDCIHDVTDNARQQYKSRFIWNHLSNSQKPWCRHHFAANHGKGDSDRASGFFKTFIRDNILAQNVVVKNIRHLYTFAARNMDNQPSGKSCCLHETQRKVMLSIEIPKIEENYEETVLPKTEGMIHGIRSTGVPGIIEIRSVDCCCIGCIRSTGKCQSQHADPWTRAVIQPGVDMRKLKTSHWEKIMMKGQTDTRTYTIMDNTKKI